MPFTVEQIREALSRHQPALVAREPDHAEAAVALVLAGAGTDLSICAIRRAEHPLDPWSGHMALPGGGSLVIHCYCRPRHQVAAGITARNPASGKFVPVYFAALAPA